MSKYFNEFTEAAAAAPVAAAGKVAAGVAKGVGKATITTAKALGKSAVKGLKVGAETAGKTVAIAGGEAAAGVVKAAGEGTAERVKKKFAGEEYDIEDAVEYFYEEGVTEEELDMIIEEVGDDIVDFIDEERKARKMNVRSKGKLKKDVAKIKANKSDVVPRKTSPKDALNRAASSRVFGKKKLKRPESTVTKATKKAKAAPKKAAPKAKAKPTPKKKASKEGIRSKIGKAYKKGVERHKAAVKKNKFASGFKSGVKAVGKAAKDVHSITQVNKKKTVNMQSYEPEGELVEGVGDQVRKGLKRHKDAVEKKKIKNRKAVPYAALAAQHEPEGELVDEKVATGPRLGEPREKGATHMNAGEQEKISKRTKAWMDKKGQKGAPGSDAMKAREAEHRAKRGVKEELSRRSKPSAKAKMAKLDAVLKRREERKVSEKEALKTEGWLGKKKEEKKPQKAMDAGARAKRKLQRKEYAAKVSGSEDNVPDEMREDSDSKRLKVLEKIKKDRRERAVDPMTTEKMLNKKKNESDPTGVMKPIVAEFVNNLYENRKKCPRCNKPVHKGSCSPC